MTAGGPAAQSEVVAGLGVRVLIHDDLPEDGQRDSRAGRDPDTLRMGRRTDCHECAPDDQVDPTPEGGP